MPFRMQLNSSFSAQNCVMNHVRSSRGNFIVRRMIVPLTHDLFGRGVMQCGEGLVGELANQVFIAVDFNWVE